MVKVAKFNELKGSLSLMAAAARDILLSEEVAFEDEARARIQQLRARNAELMADLDKLVLMPRGRELLKAIADNRPEYNRLTDQALDLDRKGQGQRRRAHRDGLGQGKAPGHLQGGG